MRGRSQLPVDTKRVVGRRRVLHVDADEVVPLPGVRDDGLEVLAAEVIAELEPEPRDLDADVGVELLAVERLERFPVGRGDRARLARVRDLLAQDVDRRHLPLGVEAPDDPERVVELLTGDVALGDPSHDRFRDGRQQPDEGAVEEGQGPWIL